MKRAFTPLQQVASRLEREPHVKLLTERQAAEYCCYFDRGCANPVAAFNKMARRKGIPFKRWGGRRHYDPRVLDAFGDGERWTFRHRDPVKPVSRSLNLVHDASVASSDSER
jgi:hypothetical protein